MSEQQQWIRRAQLEIVGDDGITLDVSDLHFRFEIRRGDLQTPNTADVRLYNLSQQTAREIERATSLRLQAGYESAGFGLIFTGNVRQVRNGRESPVDTYVDILAADGDVMYAFATVDATLAAGSTAADQLRELSRQTGTPISDEVDMDALPKTPLPRAKTMFGMGRDFLRSIAETANSAWSVQDGQIVLIPRRGYLKGGAVALTSETGLIGLPEQTHDGIRARCLINPEIRIGHLVQIDNTSIQRARVTPSPSGEAANLLLPSVAADGRYRVISMDYRGDTRGPEWYADLLCLAVDDMVPPSVAVRGWG